SAGYPGGGANAACFFEVFGSIRNICSTTQGWVMPMPVDAFGSYSPSYNLYAPAGSGVQCITYTGTWTGASSATPWTPVANGPSYPTLHPGPVTIPTHGYLAGACALGPNAMLFNVEY